MECQLSIPSYYVYFNLFIQQIEESISILGCTTAGPPQKVTKIPLGNILALFGSKVRGEGIKVGSLILL